MDAMLSGGLERIHCDDLVDQAPMDPSHTECENEPSDTSNNIDVTQVLKLPTPVDTDLNTVPSGIMMQCIVRLSKLSEMDLNMWTQSANESSETGYSLRDRPKPSLNLRFARQAKRNNTYTLSSSSSQDDEKDNPSVKPGKWKKK